MTGYCNFSKTICRLNISFHVILVLVPAVGVGRRQENRGALCRKSLPDAAKENNRDKFWQAALYP